ncbi:serine hydrolase domain-containing protein [Larkinella insperata]|uniref:Serine hydrolase domain-containing protein n=1 Tax=Larkinella insperata TaxID=332158 RepID=A0ABW3QIN1_9BACT|nr:serine hydrolase domain-containing protein [Larkinella insperata]
MFRNKLHRLMGTALLMLLVGVINSCQKDPDEPAPTKPMTWFDSFGKALDDSLKLKKIGYGYVILEGAEVRASGSGGFKSRSNEAEGEKPFTLDTKMHIASMSKTITTMAFLHLAAEKGIKTTDKIAPYLPPAWVKGENIDQLTFRDLMTHSSGIIGLGNNCANGAYSENIWSGLQQLVQRGIRITNRGKYCYQNANFGLFRVLIPSILGYSFTGDDTLDDQQTQQRYMEYVQQSVFDKAGITSANANQPSGAPTYAYTYPSAQESGWNAGSFTNTVGGYGWYLTPTEAGKLFATVLSTADQSILTTAWKDTLLTHGLAYFSGRVAEGPIRYHDGWWYLRLAQYQGVRTVWMQFPNNVTAVLFVNALHGTRGYFPSDDGNDIVTYLSRAYTLARAAKTGRKMGGTVTLEHPEPH